MGARTVVIPVIDGIQPLDLSLAALACHAGLSDLLGHLPLLRSGK